MVGVLRRGLSVLLLSLGGLGGLVDVSVGYAARLPQLGVSPLSSPGTGINVAGPAAGGGVWFTGGEVVGRVNDRGQVLAQSVSLANDPCAGGSLTACRTRGRSIASDISGS